MRGVKFLINSWKRMPKLLTIFIVVFTLAAEVLPFILHEPLGAEDYMFPKIFLFFGTVIFVCMFAIASGNDLTMSKFARSTPIAKELFTRSVPMLIVMSVVVQTVIMCAYFVFLGIKGAELTQYSDTLILGAIVCGSLLAFMPVAFSMPMGGLWGLYATFAPVAIVAMFLNKRIKLNGFGAPLPLAIGIFLGALVLGTFWTFKTSEIQFKSGKVRTYNTFTATYNK